MFTGLETIDEIAGTVADSLATRARTPRDLSDPFGRGAPGLGRAVPQPDAPPFVWARVRAPHTKRVTRAGWLTPIALAALVAETRAAGPSARLDVIVPLDSGAAAVAWARTLCAAVDDVAVSLHVQDEDAAASPGAWSGRWWRGGARARIGARAPRGTGYHAAWIAFVPAGATP
jgi:hypothetical protein